MQETKAEKLEIQRPLEILRSSARRLTDRQPSGASKLEEIYAHLKEAVADSVDTVGGDVPRLLQLAKENFPEDLEPEVLRTAEAAVEEVKAELQDALLPVNDPGSSAPPSFVPVLTISDALEALGVSLEQIHLPMQEGSKEPLRLALEQLRRAQIGLSAALAE